MALFGASSKQQKYLVPKLKHYTTKQLPNVNNCKKAFHEAADCWILHLELARPDQIPPTMSGLVQGNHQADQNVINFMIAHSNLSLFPMINNMSYEPYICNQSILPNDFCFNISDSIIGVTNNNLNFDEFIIN